MNTDALREALMAGARAPSTQPRARWQNGQFVLDDEQGQPKKKKNFWLDQISTAGGILGGIGGSFIAPLAGTAAGAGAGSALGETIENALTGESLTKNVAREGALGAVFGVGPIRGLKALGGAGKAALAGKGVVEGARQAAGQTIRGAAGKAVTGAGDDLLIKQFRFTPTQLKNFKSKFGEDASQVIKKYGFKNADDVVTKGIEPLQQQFDDLVTSIPSVSKDTLAKSLKSKYEPLLKSGVEDSVALGKSLRGQSNTLLKKYGDVIDAKELNSIRREFDSLVNYTERAANPARYGVNKRAADAIRSTLQKADPTGSLKGVGKELQKLNQFADNAAKQAQLGRGSLPGGLSNLLGGSVGGGAFGGPLGAAGGYIGTAAVNSGPGRRALASGAGAIGNKLTQAGAKSAARGLSTGAIGTRVGGAGALRGMAGGVPDTSEEELERGGLEDALMSGEQGFGEGMGAPVEQSPYSKENLMADIQRDPENAEEYFQTYQMYQEIFAPPEASQKPLNQGQQERADLIQALDNTEGLMEGGSINYGPLGSRIEGIKGMFNAADPETLAFKNTVSGLRAAITKARAGASLTPGELKMLAQYTPSDTDSEQVVRSKLAQLRALYGNQAPTGGGSTIEDALSSLQGAY